MLTQPGYRVPVTWTDEYASYLTLSTLKSQ